jgi:hypothetical protein
MKREEIEWFFKAAPYLILTVEEKRVPIENVH